MEIQAAKVYQRNDCRGWPILQIDGTKYLFVNQSGRIMHSHPATKSFNTDVWNGHYCSDITIEEALEIIQEYNNGQFPELEQ